MLRCLCSGSQLHPRPPPRHLLETLGRAILQISQQQQHPTLLAALATQIRHNRQHRRACSGTPRATARLTRRLACSARPTTIRPNRLPLLAFLVLLLPITTINKLNRASLEPPRRSNPRVIRVAYSGARRMHQVCLVLGRSRSSDQYLNNE